MEREDNQKPSGTLQLVQASEEGRVEEIENGEGGHGRRGGTKRKEIVAEVKQQVWLAGPLICMSILEHALYLISLMFIGHLGALPLAGASLAISFCSVTGYSVINGMAGALDTLCGQCYGAEQYSLMGIHLQRAMLVLLLVCIPLAVIWANTETILVALGQNAQIAEQAGIYARFLIPSLFADALVHSIVTYLQSQNIVYPMLMLSSIATILHVPLCWVLIFKCGLGNKGAALADSITFWVEFLLMALYVKFSPSCAQTWTGFSKQAFRNFMPFVRLAIPSAVMVCLEMWAFEIIVLLSGLLPNPKLETSVLSISLNTLAIVWAVAFGLGSALSTRVANELGAGNSKAAYLAVRVNIVMGIMEGIMAAGVLLLIRNVWGYAYTNEREIIKHLAAIMPILAASSFLDGIQNVLSGNAIGCGWQKIGAFVNLGSYYLIGLPLAAVFAFVIHLGGKGLWLGMVCALFVQVILLSIVTMRTDWEKEAKEASERVYETTDPVDTLS